MVLMRDFNAYIGLGEEQSPNNNGQRLMNLTWTCNLRIGNGLPECKQRWTGEYGQTTSVIDYILLSREIRIHKTV